MKSDEVYMLTLVDEFDQFVELVVGDAEFVLV